MKKIIIGFFFFYLVLFPFGQLARLPLPFLNLPEINLYLTDIVLSFLLLFWLIWRFFINKNKYKPPFLTKPILLFSGLALLSLLISSFRFSNLEVLISSLYFIRWIVYAGLYFILVDLKSEFKKALPYYLLIIGFFVALFGLVQYLIYPNLKFLEPLGWDPHFYRVTSTFFDPGFTGLILALTLILLTVLSWKKQNKLWWLLWPFIFVMLLLTYSRASWLAFLVGIGIFFIYKKAFRFLFLIIVLLGLSWFFIPRPEGEGGKLERTYSINARLENYKQGFFVFKKNPLLGVGFNTYRYARRDYELVSEEKWQTSHSTAGADSSLLFVLATTGILGFLSYLWLYFKTLRGFKNIVIIASVLAILVHSFFLNSLFYPWVMAWFWILLATESS